MTTRNRRCKVFAGSKPLCTLHTNLLAKGRLIKTIDPIEDGAGVGSPAARPPDPPAVSASEGECQCCFDEGVALISCGNPEHAACADCIRRYFDANIGQALCACMMAGCGRPYRADDLQGVLTPKVFDAHVSSLKTAACTNLAKQVDNFQACPFCGSYGVIIEARDPASVPCANCCRSWCSRCRRAAHADSCLRLVDADAAAVARMVSIVIDEALLHECPKCRMRYVKSDGCNLMTCPRCHAYSCYICGIQTFADAKGNKYNHFRAGKCTVYNGNPADDLGIRQGNSKFDNQRIERALAQLVEANPDAAVRRLIADAVRDLDQPVPAALVAYVDLDVRHGRARMCCVIC